MSKSQCESFKAKAISIFSTEFADIDTFATKLDFNFLSEFEHLAAHFVGLDIQPQTESAMTGKVSDILVMKIIAVTVIG